MWEHLKKRQILGLFLGQNLAFQLKINNMVTIENRLSFPKLPSKSRLSLLIIEIFALKVQQYRPKTTETVMELALKPEQEFVLSYIKMFLFRICSQGKV